MMTNCGVVNENFVVLYLARVAVAAAEAIIMNLEEVFDANFIFFQL